MTKLTSALLAAGLLGLAAASSRLEGQRSGVEIWSQTCGKCHLPQPAIRYTADQWETIMTDMAIFARLTDADASAVLEFLKGGAKRVASTDRFPREGELVAVLASLGPVDLPRLEQGGTGAELYGRNCAACHGKAGKGDGAAAAALNPRPTNLADSAFQASRTDAQLTEVITSGKGTMPAYGTRLGGEAVRALVAYIRSLGSGSGR